MDARIEALKAEPLSQSVDNDQDAIDVRNAAIDRTAAIFQRQSAQPGSVERVEAEKGERPHLINGEFQSDKYPTCPRGKVPLSCKDPTAQDLLWEYAQRRRSVDADFADDLESALVTAGYISTPATSDKEARVKEEHKCDVCSMEIRNLFAVAYNAVNAIDAAKRQEGSWERAYRKVEQLRDGVEMMQPIIDAHFAEVNKSPDAALPTAPIEGDK